MYFLSKLFPTAKFSLICVLIVPNYKMGRVTKSGTSSVMCKPSSILFLIVNLAAVGLSIGPNESGFDEFKLNSFDLKHFRVSGYEFRVRKCETHTQLT